MQRLRCARQGKKHRPFYWVIATDSRQGPGAEANHKLGTYDPHNKQLHLDLAATEKQLQQGAQPSDMVRKLILRARREQQAAAGNVATP